MSFPDVNILRKSGRLSEALSLAEADYARTPGRMEATALFWCLNDVVKKSSLEDARIASARMRDLALRHDPSNEIMSRAAKHALFLVSPEGQRENEGWRLLEQLKSVHAAKANQRVYILQSYLALGLAAPSKLHSRMMAEAVKTESWPYGAISFSSFAEAWDFRNLSEEDWERREANNGYKYPSLVERIIAAYIKDIHQSGAKVTDSFRSLLATACERYHDNLNLQRYDAQILVKDGHVDCAIARYKQLLANAPNKFYIWGDLADIVADPDLQIGLLCSAIATGAYDEFLVNIRLRLAELLCNRRMYENAATELHFYRCAHNSKGWPLKRKYFNVANRLPKDVVMGDNRQLYSHYKDLAYDFIYSALPTKYMVKVWEKKDNYNGKPTLSWQLRDNTDSYWISPRKFRLDFRTGNGAAFHVRMVDNKIVWMRPADFPTGLSWLKEETGPLQIKQQGQGKVFGFVNGVFVPAHLLYSKEKGSIATVKAIENGSQRWAALTLE